MMAHERLKKAAAALRTGGQSLIETFEDEAVVRPENQCEWIDITALFFSWYYSAVQVMTECGFGGLDRFQSLCEGDDFSMPRFFTGLVLGRQPEPGWHDKMYPRLWQMYFTVEALPGAMGLVMGEEAPGSDPKGVQAALTRVRKALDTPGIPKVGFDFRHALEDAVNTALINWGNVLKTAHGRYAKFSDKVQTLREHDLLNAREADVLKKAYGIAGNGTARPEPKPTAATIRRALDEVEFIARERLLKPPTF